MDTESVVALCSVSVGAGVAHSPVTQKAKKHQKDFCASSNTKGLLNCLWWHWLGHMRIMACLPLNSCGPQERKSTQQVSEVLLY